MAYSPVIAIVIVIEIRSVCCVSVSVNLVSIVSLKCINIDINKWLFLPLSRSFADSINNNRYTRLEAGAAKR